MQLTNAMKYMFALALISNAADAQESVSPTASIGGYEAKFIDVNGIRTRFYEEGAGEPMILLHGAPWGGVASANTWVDNIATLSRHFHLYVPDRIGAGMTDNPKRDEDYNEIVMFQHMRDFIETLDLAPVHVVAHSLGGLSLYMAALPALERAGGFQFSRNARRTRRVSTGSQNGDVDTARCLTTLHT
jgi:hypothetical protein